MSHVLTCSYTRTLRDWTAEVGVKLGITCDLPTLLPLGLSAGADAKHRVMADALWGAAAMALRKARNFYLANHAPVPTEQTFLNEARRQLRRHIDTDWLHACGHLELLPRDDAHRADRPCGV